VAQFYESEAADLISTDDFAVTVTSSATDPALSFSGIFEFVYGEQFGFGDKEIPSLTCATSAVATLSQDDEVTVPASAITTSSSAKDFKILVKKPDNTGITVLLLESA